MTKELELLSKMDLTEENRAKLQALLEESKKTGKVASKKLVETLDAVDATEEQTEKFYDVLEAAGVFGVAVLPLMILSAAGGVSSVGSVYLPSQSSSTAYS